MRLRDVVGKFVVMDGTQDPRAADEAGTGAGVSGAVASTSPSGEAPGGFDVSGIYRRAGIKELAFGADQALEVLASLEILNSVRSERGLDIKRKAVNELVRAKSSALSITLAAVLDDARLKVESLNSAAGQAADESADFIAARESEVAQLEEQIREKRGAIDRIRAQEQQVAGLCRAEAERLQAVLDILDTDHKP